MRKRLFIALLPTLFLAACKTSGSRAKDFTIHGDPQAAHQLIVETVLKAYPDVAPRPGDPDAAAQLAEIDKFATALADGKTEQAQSSDEVLQQAYAKLQMADPNQPSEFDFYVTAEFAALTNYTTVQKIPGTKLKYIGTAKR